MPSEGRLDTPPEGSNFGLLAASTSRVPEEISDGVGAGIFSSDPSNWRLLKVPLPSAVFPTPLMLMMRSAPSESTAMADGNQPEGTAPATIGSAPATFH